MAYAQPTVDQFKGQFFRDFPYAVPSYGATGVVTVAAGVVTAVIPISAGYFYVKDPVCILTGGGGSGAVVSAAAVNNAVSAYAVIDGGSGYVSAPTLKVVSQDGDDTDLKKVTNRDIVAAMGMTPANINRSLFSDEATYQTAFNLLAAHYMVTNLLASSQGVKSQYDWLTQQRTVGNVNASFSIPERVKNSPFLSTLTATRYGAQYISLISPLLHGNVVIAFGATTP